MIGVMAGRRGRRDRPGRMPGRRSRATAVGIAFAALAACGRAPAPAWPTTAWEGRFPDADTVRVADLAPGVRHVYLWLREGPWAVHVVEIDRTVCRPVITALKAGPTLEARATPPELAPAAIAAINADFFFTPAGIPVGPHVHASRVLAGPGTRPAWTRTPSGEQRAGPVSLIGYAAVGTDTARLGHVNRVPDSARHHPPRPGLRLYDAWYGPRAPVDSVGPTAVLRPIPGDPRAGSEETPPNGAVVVAIQPPGTASALDGARVALQAGAPAARDWIDRRAIGDTVTWRAAVVPEGGGDAAEEAVGGFPVLVAHGRGVLSEQTGILPTFGPRRHPRTAVGWDVPGRRILWVVVDGRQGSYSAGMSLTELEWLFLGLGATDALNLDGGGSSGLSLRGTLANRPSDDAGERPVANVLALERCR